MINLTTNSWHLRLFLSTHYNLYSLFHSSDYQYEPPKQTNLCQYLRTLLVWFPLMILANVLPYGTVLFAMFYPMYMYGASNYLLTAAIVVGLIIGIFTAIALVVWFATRKFLRSAIGGAAHSIYHVVYGDSFFGLMCRWIRDRHQRICSLITITREGEPS